MLGSIEELEKAHRTVSAEYGSVRRASDVVKADVGPD